MEQMNLHKQKLYALIIAVVGVIAVLLPWWSSPSVEFFGQRIGGVSINGLRDLGIISFLGFLAAGGTCFLGDRTKAFEGQNKLLTAGCFAAAALFTLIQFARASSSTAIGIWLSLIAGIAGVVVVYFLKPEQLGSKPPTTP
jgi:hypothetical protein